MKTQLKSMLSIAFLLALFAGCDKKEEEQKEQDVINLSTNELAFDYVPDSQIITVASTKSWSVYIDANWVTIDPVAGYQSTEVTVSVTNNLAYTSRTADIVFVTEKSRKTLTVVQQGAPKPVITSVSISPSSATVYREYSQQFSVSVEGTDNPPATVTWSLSGNESSSTTISNSGLLTVSNDESASNLTVCATSTFDTEKYGTADVSVEDLMYIEIDGITWATRNVDAPGSFAATPESVGMFYQWNRRIGWSSTDPLVNTNGETVWDSTTPSGDEWEKANDPCPSGWRVPTYDEQQSLNNAPSSWTSRRSPTTQYKVYGRAFGVAPYTVFLPAAGVRYYDDGLLYGRTNTSCYWSSSGSQSADDKAYYLYFNEAYTEQILNYRTYALPVRCVEE